MENVRQVPDANLLVLQQQVALGDQAAFREIYTLFYKRLYHFTFAITKTKESAEEIVEDVFVRIWQQRTNLPSIQNLKVYLYTASKNTALNYLSRKARENITEPFDHIDISLMPTEINPEEIMITDEILHKIRTAIENLPPRCKMIFKLVREDNLKYKEVSEILNISINTIDAQMAIAVKRIAATLQSDLHLKRKPIANN